MSLYGESSILWSQSKVCQCTNSCILYIDDIAVDQNGQDVYLGIKEAGRYRQAPNIMDLHTKPYELYNGICTNTSHL